MWRHTLFIIMLLVVLVFSGGPAFAECPSSDHTIDYSADVADVTKVAGHGLADDPCVLDDMVHIPTGVFAMGDHHGDGYSDETPLHMVLLDSFRMSRYEITNQQYCDYLNSAYPAQLKVAGGIVYAASDSSNSYPYCDTLGYPIREALVTDD